MIVIDDAAGMTKYMWEYLDIIVIGGEMDIVERLRLFAKYDAPTAIIADNAFRRADEIERLRQYRSEFEDAIASNNQTEIFNKAARLEGLLTALKEKE